MSDERAKDETGLPAKTCGRTAYASRSGLLRCDRPSGHTGSHSAGWRPAAILSGLSWRAAGPGEDRYGKDGGP